MSTRNLSGWTVRPKSEVAETPLTIFDRGLQAAFFLSAPLGWAAGGWLGLLLGPMVGMPVCAYLVYRLARALARVRGFWGSQAGDFLQAWTIVVEEPEWLRTRSLQ